MPMGSFSRVLVTGGAGFVGSHAAERFSQAAEVVVLDNLSRMKLLGRDAPQEQDFNWQRLKNIKNVSLVNGDVRDAALVQRLAKDCDVIIHAAAQTAVTASVANPSEDFSTNVVGTFNVLEAARKAAGDVAVVFCSTNKVYGSGPNGIPITEEKTRYAYSSSGFSGVPEDFGVDLCEHTPYGCSKLAGDLYCQDYAKLYGVATGIFRMSCIYGTRQFGVEDQGWVAHFAISAVTGRPVTLFGDGKQVRDVLFVSDLLDAYEAFIAKSPSLKGEVFNLGGGRENTISLLELAQLLSELGTPLEHSFAGWRPSDQRVFVADTSKARRVLGWRPKISPAEGVKKLHGWVTENKSLFSQS